MKVKNKVLLAVTTALLGCSTPVAAKITHTLSSIVQVFLILLHWL